VLDACVLYSFSTRDILLRLFEAGLFRAVWNTEILDEMARNLTANGAADGDRMRLLLEGAFEDALDTLGDRYLPDVPKQVSAKDRHVVATALAQRADVIVTSNLNDYPPDALQPFGLAVQNPDEFLLHQLAMDEERTVQAVKEQMAELQRPSFSLVELARVAPDFAQRLAALLPELRI
jgi:hypothetical protein